MKLFLLLFTIALTSTTFAQNNSDTRKREFRLTENTIVKDSSGTVYATQTWRALLSTGRYTLKPDSSFDNNSLLLVRRSEEEFEKFINNLPKPKESNAFRPGSSFQHIKERDINNEKINTKKLAGKILVINFWFIKCPPCVMEMPELNRIVEEYKNDSSVVFIAIALDESYDIKQFLKKQPFNYSIIGGGRPIASNYRVSSFPTNIVVSQEGKIHFSSSGYSGVATTSWIKRSIEELKDQQPSETTAKE